MYIHIHHAGMMPAHELDRLIGAASITTTTMAGLGVSGKSSDNGSDGRPQIDCTVVRVRLHIIRNGRIENVGKSQSCMVSKLRIICKRTVGPRSPSLCLVR